MKKIIPIGFLLIYLLALGASAMLVIKPGAGMFYHKTKLQMERCSPAAGFAVRCPVRLPPAIFPAEGVLLYENGRQLPREPAPYVSTAGDGTFATETNEEGGFSILFAPLGNSDPFTDGKTYRAYFSVSFLNQTTGILSLGVVLAGLISFLSFAFKQAKGVKDGKALPKEALLWIDGYLAQMGRVMAGIRSAADGGWRSFFESWGKMSAASGAAACALIFMEWLFLITGASFMDGMSLGEELKVFFLSALFLILLALALGLAFLSLALLLRLVRLGWVAFLLADLSPAALITALIVLVVENFTYVIFHFGILTSAGALRSIYGVLIGITFASVYGWRLSSWKLWDQQKSFTGKARWPSLVVLGVTGIALVIALLSYDARFQEAAAVNPSASTAPRRPNIVLIGSDGVNASHMSVYGYERNTTPILRELSSTLLIAENAFTNSAGTYGSISSIFTGKLPFETGTIYPPTILQGSDAFEHLPGILSKAGYKTVEIGVPHYVDAFTMNIQDGFDLVNGKQSIQKDPLVKAWRDAGYATSAYFLYKLEEKLANRIRHALLIETIENPFEAVTQPASWLEDRQKMDELLAFFNQNDQPLFAHVHLMGTHGARFYVKAVFSQGEEQTEDWMTDFYDDSVLAFDSYLGELITALKENGQYENTVLIVYSDHAMKLSATERIPLIFRFPGDQFAGRISGNSQNLDIAPTVLDYLGMDIPEWMSGSSLLRTKPGKDRLIFSAQWIKAYQAENKFWYIDVNQFQPPFYQFRYARVIACDHWYELTLATKEWMTGIVPQHTSPCAEGEAPGKAQVMEAIADLLEGYGFDVTSLRDE
jgi:arylsulfatase A-like enzyme